MLTAKQKQIADQIWHEIQKANHILLHCHPNPDPDSVGSSLAMMHSLESINKKAIVIAGDSELKSSYKQFPGAEKIVLKNFFEIDLEKIDLFLILDSSGRQQISKKNKVIFPDTMRSITIDHHPSNLGGENIDLIADEYPATAQILFDLLKYWKINITPEAAINLYLGLYGDTGGFKYPKTTFYTLQAASELAKLNPNFPELIFNYENNNEPGTLRFQGLALSNIENYFQNQVAISCSSFDELQKHQIKYRHTQNVEISNLLKSVNGWELGVSMIETTIGESSLSFRTRDSKKYPVHKIAIALGGGGHPAAAGATVYKPFEEAKKYLLSTIQKTFPDLGSP